MSPAFQSATNETPPPPLTSSFTICPHPPKQVCSERCIGKEGGKRPLGAAAAASNWTRNDEGDRPGDWH
ncbi:hypothetical protein MRX96_013025 [Rhipicephalus microplus]